MDIKKQEERLLRLGKAARYLGVHTNTLRRWAEDGKVPFVRIGKRGDRRFRPADLDALLTPTDPVGTPVLSKE